MNKDYGVLEGSKIYFLTPSSIAKNMFFYLICRGEFLCDEHYHVQRDHYNSYLIMYLLEGSMKVSYEGKDYMAFKGDCIFLNCYKAHTYCAATKTRFLFIHFDGNVSSDFFELIYKNKGIILNADCTKGIGESMSQILDGLRQNMELSEPTVSHLIHGILCEMLSFLTLNGSSNPLHDSISTAIAYIKDNYSQNLSVEQIAKNSNLSLSRLAHLFKQETGFSVYEYLLKCRLDKAKQLLKQSNRMVIEIAYSVGFQSEANFIYTFHRKVGMSPSKFRKLPF